MRRVIQTMWLAVCLAIVVEAPRGLALAALAAGIGIARSVYAQQLQTTTFDAVSSVKRNRSGEQGGRNALDRRGGRGHQRDALPEHEEPPRVASDARLHADGAAV